jgi:hypothetical protein
LSDLLDMIAQDKLKLATERERNRARFPKFTAWLDAVEAQFGKCRVIHVREGDQEIGKPSA